MRGYENAIFVTDVKLVKFDGPVLEIHRLEDLPMYSEDKDGTMEYLNVKAHTELVEAKKFKTHDGRIVCIGASKEVQDILRIPFDSFDNMSEQLYDSSRRNQKLHLDLAKEKRDTVAYTWEIARLKSSWAYRIVTTIKSYMEFV